MSDFGWEQADLADLEDERRQQHADRRRQAIRDAEPETGIAPSPSRAPDLPSSPPDFESSPTCSEPLPSSE